MNEPRRWTLAELERDSEQAKSIFREERLKESLSQYTEFFEQFSTVFRDLVDRLPALARAEHSAQTLVDILSEDKVSASPQGESCPLELSLDGDETISCPFGLGATPSPLHRRQQPADAVAVGVLLEAAGGEGGSPRRLRGRSAVDPQEA